MSLHFWIPFGVVCGCLFALICLVKGLRSRERRRQINLLICVPLVVATLVFGMVNAVVPPDNVPAPVPDSVQIVFGEIHTLQDTYVSSLRAPDGTVLWRQSLGSGLGDQFTLHNRVVYAIGCHLPDPTNWKCISALRASDGTPMWQRVLDTQAILPSPLGGVPIIEGKPIVLDENMYVQVDDDRNSYLYALRTSDGVQLWHISLDHFDGSGVQAVTEERVCIYKDHHLIALRASSGTQVWSTPMNEAEQVKSDAGLLFLPSQKGGIRALRTLDGSLAWVAQPADSDQIILLEHEVIAVPSAVSAHGTLARRGRDGAILWRSQEKLDGPLFLSSGHLLQNDAPSDENRLSARDAQDGKLIWQRSLPDLKGAPPVESEGVVYVSGHNTLYALRASDGVLLWQHQEQTPESLAFSRPAVIHGVIFVFTVVTVSLSEEKNPFPSVFHSFLCQLGCTSRTGVNALRLSDGSFYWQDNAAHLAVDATDMPLQILS